MAAISTPRLANKNGELVLPVLITGNMNRPMVAPDVQQIAKMKLNNLLPTAGGLIGGKGGANGIGGLVGGLWVVSSNNNPSSSKNRPTGSSKNRSRSRRKPIR